MEVREKTLMKDSVANMNKNHTFTLMDRDD